MQRKAQQQAADALEDSQFMQSLSAREAELAQLERAHQAAARNHNTKLKWVPILSCLAHTHSLHGIALSSVALLWYVLHLSMYGLRSCRPGTCAPDMQLAAEPVMSIA